MGATCINFYPKRQNRGSMLVVLTVLMMLAMLVLLPLSVTVNFTADITQKTLFVQVRLFGIKVFEEKFLLDGRYLVCRGSVNVQLDVFSLRGDTGKGVANAVHVDSVQLCFAVDFCRYSVFVLPITDVLCAVGTALACGFSHCKIHTQTCFSPQNAVFGRVRLTVSLAEVLAVLAKQGIEYGKSTNK